MFMFRILPFMFMLAGMFAFPFAGLAVGLGEVVTAGFELALPFAFSVALQAAPETARVNKVRKPMVRRISFLLCTHLKCNWGPILSGRVKTLIY